MSKSDELHMKIWKITFDAHGVELQEITVAAASKEEAEEKLKAQNPGGVTAVHAVEEHVNG